MSGTLTLTHNWRLAMVIGALASLMMSFAFFLVTYTFRLKLGITSSLVAPFAALGFPGIVIGMLLSGNPHSGGPLPIVLAVATIVNSVLYTLIAYGIIRLFRMVFGR